MLEFYEMDSIVASNDSALAPRVLRIVLFSHPPLARGLHCDVNFSRDAVTSTLAFGISFLKESKQILGM